MTDLRSPHRSHDIRELLGMQTKAATVIVWFFVLTFLLLALVTAEGVSTLWPVTLALLAVTAAAVAVVRVAGDPLPLRPTLALAAVGPVSCALVLAVVPVPIDSALQTWPLSASTAIYTFMCVRGRTWYAWLGLLATIGTCMTWSTLTGQGPAEGVSMSAINLAPLLMATFFAYTMRPDAHAIFRLRDQATRRVAARAADSAVLEERDRQLRRLDELARPLLERIGTGVELDAEERLACRLLEAHLRDSLRAPGLTHPAVVASARAARARGVEVILLDDRGMDSATAEVHERFVTAVANELDAARDGAVTVRVLPPGREAAATVLASGGFAVRRVEFGADGRPTEPAPEPGPATAVHSRN